MGSHTGRDVASPGDALDLALADLLAVVEQARGAAYDGSGGTPCPGWDLAALVAHVRDAVGVCADVLALAEVVDTGVAVAAAAGATPLDDLAEAVRRVDGRSAWPEGSVRVGTRHLPADLARETLALELWLHTWDLAAGLRIATGPARAERRRDVAGRLLRHAAALFPRDRGGLFGPPLRPTGVGDPERALLRLSGRDPAWAGAPQDPPPGP